MTSADKVEFVQYEASAASRGHHLYEITEETPSELGKVNLSYIPGLNDTLNTTISSCGRFSPVFSDSRSSVHGSQCVLNRSDGSTIVVTPPREHRELQEKPVTEKEIKVLKIVSILSIFFFPPAGIAAVIFAMKAAKDFDRGIEMMDLTAARKNIKYTERLIILSIVCGILMYTLIFAGIGRAVYGHGGYKDGSRSTPVK